MVSKIHDFLSLVNAFIISEDDPSQLLRSTIIRWCRAYHNLALEDFQGVGFTTCKTNQNPSLRRPDLTDEEVEILQRCRKRNIQISSWVFRIVCENRDMFKCGDAILSRAFQIISEANVFFNESRRVVETPFPFPFVQLTQIMIYTWALIMPIIVGTFFPRSYFLAFLIAGSSTWILFAVNEVAAILENPWEEASNNLPALYYTVAFEDDVGSVKFIKYPKAFEDLRNVQSQGDQDIGEEDSSSQLPNKANNINPEPKSHDASLHFPVTEKSYPASAVNGSVSAEGLRHRVDHRKLVELFRGKAAQRDTDLISRTQSLTNIANADLKELMKYSFDDSVIPPRVYEGLKSGDKKSDSETTATALASVKESTQPLTTTTDFLSTSISDDSVTDKSKTSSMSSPSKDLMHEEHMDGNDLLYHTVHGASAVRMSLQLKNERDRARYITANRALVLQKRIHDQRIYMRHHFHQVPPVVSDVDIGETPPSPKLSSRSLSKAFRLFSDSSGLSPKISESSNSADKRQAGPPATEEVDTDEIHETRLPPRFSIAPFQHAPGAQSASVTPDYSDVFLEMYPTPLRNESVTLTQVRSGGKFELIP